MNNIAECYILKGDKVLGEKMILEALEEDGKNYGAKYLKMKYISTDREEE